MSFSADAIGFYLQLEDQLTPTLKSAGSAYTKFVKSLETANTRASKSASKGLSALADLVESFSALPSAAGKAYDAAFETMKNKSKPIKQTIDLNISTKSKNKLVSHIGAAISKALGGVKVHLSAQAPESRSKLFDTKVSLRKAYKGMVQPPDMVGGFKNLPKLNKGGIITDGSSKKIDDVLALLSKGEMVLPADVSKAVQGMAEQKRSPSGKFEKMPRELKDALSNVEAMSKALEILHERVEIGLDASAPKLFEQAIAASEKSLETLQKAAKGVDPKFLDKAAPKAKALNDQLKTMKEELPHVEGTMEKLFGKLLGPARFLALRAALKDTHEALVGVKDSSSEVLNEFGGGTDNIESVYTNFQQMNRVLGLTRDGLSDFRIASMKVSAAYGSWYNAPWSPAEFSESMEGLVQAGMRDKDTMLRLNGAITATVKATGASQDSLAKSAYLLTDAYGLSEDQMSSTFATLDALGQNASASSHDLINQMQENMSQMGPFLDNLVSPDSRKAAIENMARLSAALSDSWADSDGKIANLFAQALGGSIDASNTLAKSFGVNMEEMKDAAVSGDFSPILKHMSDSFSNLDERTKAATLSMIGLSSTPAEFSKISSSTDTVAASFERMRKITISGADGLKLLVKHASDNQTMFEKLKNGIAGFVQTIPGMGEAINFFKEFNPVVALSVIHLAKFAWTSAVEVIPVLTSAMISLAGTATAMTATGAAAAAATVPVTILDFAIASAGETAAVAVVPTTFFGAALAFLTAPITLTVLGIAALAAVVGTLIYGLATGADWAKKFGMALLLITNPLMILPLMFSGTFRNILADGIEFMSSFMDNISGWLEGVLTKFYKWADELPDVIAKGIESIPEVIGNLFSGKAVESHLGAAIWNFTKSLTTMLALDLLTVPAIIGKTLLAVGKGIFKGLWRLVSSYPKALLGLYENLYNMIVNKVNTFTGWLTDAASWVSNLFGGGSTTPAPQVKLASGGIVTKPTVALVGESGPEAVLPLTGRNAPENLLAPNQVDAASASPFVSSQSKALDSFSNMLLRVTDNLGRSFKEALLAVSPLPVCFEATATNIAQARTAVVTPQQIDTVSKPVTVIVDNKDEVEATNKTNTLLMQLIELVAANQSVSPVVVSSPRGRPQSILTQGMAGGQF